MGLLALLPPSSFAAPIGGVADVRIPSTVTRVEYQCWYADGSPHCANLNVPAGPRIYSDYRPDYHYYCPYFGHYRVYRPVQTPRALRTGSRRWWKSMEYWGRAGNQE